jgi:hypothetical protein
MVLRAERTSSHGAKEGGRVDDGRAGRASAAGRGCGPGFGYFLVPCHRIVPYGRVYKDGRYVRIYVRMCVGSGGVFQVCSILL